tara:strand:- start:293 stop:634 length:342 start_codon:yes stop_codon:yes gene_type:complete
MKKDNQDKFDILNRILKEISRKKKFSPLESYVSKLLNADNDLVLKKVGEESTEFILAAKNGDKKEIIHETTDLIFHILIALEFFNVDFEQILEEFEKREGVSGIDEKNARKQS